MKYLSFEKSVGGVLYRKQDGNILFLLLQYRSGQWDFPKGHVEKRESEEQTLRREIKEETGIEDIAIFPKFRAAVCYFYSAKGEEKKEREDRKEGIYIFKRTIFYTAEITTNKVRIDFENKDFIWLNYDQAYGYLSNPDSKKILKKVQKCLGK